MNTLEAKDVAFRYFGAPAPALHGVDVSLRAGEHIALVGYNGAGKTTLTKLLAALYTPDGGALTVNGVLLSGGQEQKLAVARVLACPEKQLVILDEASSALDPVSESRLNRAILAFCKGKMLVLISHRLSLTKEMDHIYYMEKGTVAEHGTHAQLMAQNGHYAQMYRLQAQNYVSTPAAGGTQPDPAAL